MPLGCPLEPAGASASVSADAARADEHASGECGVHGLNVAVCAQTKLKRPACAAGVLDAEISRPGCQKPGRLADRDAQPRAQSGDMSKVPRLNIRTPEPLTFATNSLR